LTSILVFAHAFAFAEQAGIAKPDMASELRSSGKIYVVVLVLATIFAGIIAFLIYLERRIAKLEQELKS